MSVTPEKVGTPETRRRRPRLLERLVPAGRTQSAISLLSFCVSFIVVAALIPVLVRTLGAREYGAWAVTGGVANYVMVFDFGLSLGVTRFVARYREGEPERAEYAITVAMGILLLVGAGVVLATFLLAGTWQSHLHVPHAGVALECGGVATVFTLLAKVLQSALEGSGVIAATRLVQAGGSILFVAGGIAVVTTVSQPLEGLSFFLVAQSIAVATALGALLLVTWGRLPVRRTPTREWIEVFRYSLTLQGGALLVVALDPATRFLVAAMAGPAVVAPVDIALRARAQFQGAALAATRPFVPALGRVNDETAAAAKAETLWRLLLPVAATTSLFLAVSAYFLAPAVFGGAVGHSAAKLAAVILAAWIPAVAAIVPFLFLLMYGHGRDMLVVQASNAVVAIIVLAALIRVSPEWAPIAALGAGSVMSAVSTVRRARVRVGQHGLFRPGDLWRSDRAPLVAPAVALAAYLLPFPLYLRAPLSVIAWVALAQGSIVRLLREAG